MNRKALTAAFPATVPVLMGYLPKNSTEYPSCNPALLPSSGVSMAKEVLAVRGIARHGDY